MEAEWRIYASVNKPSFDSDNYFHQCWNVMNWTLGDKLKWNLNQNVYIFIQDNAIQNVVWKMAAILARPQRVKISHDCISWLLPYSCGTSSFLIFYLIVTFYFYPTKMPWSFPGFPPNFFPRPMKNYLIFPEFAMPVISLTVHPARARVWSIFDWRRDFIDKQ